MEPNPLPPRTFESSLQRWLDLSVSNNDSTLHALLQSLRLVEQLDQHGSHKNLNLHRLFTDAFALGYYEFEALRLEYGHARGGKSRISWRERKARLQATACTRCNAGPGEQCISQTGRIIPWDDWPRSPKSRSRSASPLSTAALMGRGPTHI